LVSTGKEYISRFKDPDGFAIRARFIPPAESAEKTSRDVFHGPEVECEEEDDDDEQEYTN